MADTIFNPGWSGSLYLYTGSTQTAIPCLTGSGIARNSDYLTPSLAQGSAANAQSVNNIPMRKVSSVAAQTYGFATLINATFLNSLFITRDATGDLNMFAVKFSPHSGNVEQDSAKASSIHLECAADGPVIFSFGMLGQGNPNATFGGSGTAALNTSTPYYWNNVSLSFGTGSLTALTEVHSFSLDLNTGAHYAAVFDSNDFASQIDPGILTGAFSLIQRPGATNLMASAINGKVAIAIGTCTITLQVRRVSVGKAVDANGASLVVSQWKIDSLDGTPKVVIA